MRIRLQYYDTSYQYKSLFLYFGFCVPGLSPGTFEQHIWQQHRWKIRRRQWQQMKAERGNKQRSSLKEEENEKEWKWEEEEERRPSANIHVNWWTSLPTVDYWSEPTLLKTHWTHCTDPHDYSLHWASPFIVNDSLIIWMMWIGLICDMHDIFLKNSCFQL